VATRTQRRAAKRNLGKAQAAWRDMSSRTHARRQPSGRGRAKPGARGGGGFFHIEVRPRREFRTFRTQDVGKKGGLERVAGKRASGSWDTQKWLISKEHAHRVGGRLVPDTADARKRLYSRKVNPKTGRRRNLGTFNTRAAAEKHERAVQYFKRH